MISRFVVGTEFLSSCSVLGFLFVPTFLKSFVSGGLILAADYSQLELRILAHLSHDHRLIQVLNTGADVFKSIAAEWKMIELESVGDNLRQQAKQVIFSEHT